MVNVLVLIGIETRLLIGIETRYTGIKTRNIVEGRQRTPKLKRGREGDIVPQLAAQSA